jgi:Bacterial antitoxin of type II TA system, VapB
MLDEAMKFTGAKTKREAVVTAVERFNRLKRLERLNARVRGQFRDFMTQAELKAMRAADMPKVRR